MLAEFKYGLEPKETFGDFVDQTKPNRFFYLLKKVHRLILGLGVSLTIDHRSSSPTFTSTRW
jgi:hypothetical protein